MTQSVKIATCQLPVIREEVETALLWIEKYAQRAATLGARLVCFPECYLQGYLLEEASARAHAIDLDSSVFSAVLQRLATVEPVLVIGMIEAAAGSLFNTAVVIHRGKLLGRYRKTHLLTGEHIFTAGDAFPVFDVDGLKFGINICSDTRFPDAAFAVAEQGAQLILCPANNLLKRANAHKWKDQHHPIRASRAKESGCWLISADVTGEYKDSIALGPTAIMNPDGQVVAQVPLEQAGMVTANIPTNDRTTAAVDPR